MEEMAEVIEREHPAYAAAMAAAAGAVARHGIGKAPVIGYNFRDAMRQDMLAAGDPFGLAACESLKCPVCGRNLLSVRDAEGRGARRQPGSWAAGTAAIAGRR